MEQRRPGLSQNEPGLSLNLPALMGLVTRVWQDKDSGKLSDLWQRTRAVLSRTEDGQEVLDEIDAYVKGSFPSTG